MTYHGAMLDSSRPLPRREALLWLPGLCWAVLLVFLWKTGAQPSRPSPLVDVAWQYPLQALYVAPLLRLLFEIWSRITARVARVPADVLPELQRALVLPYALPLLLLHLLPETLALLVGGFETMARLPLFTLPLSAIATLTWMSLRVRPYTTSAARALAATLTGLLVQTLVGSPWLR